MNMKTAWGNFEKTGTINDYINFVNIKTTELEGTADVSHNHPRDNSERAKSGRERPTDYNSDI